MGGWRSFCEWYAEFLSKQPENEVITMSKVITHQQILKALGLDVPPEGLVLPEGDDGSLHLMALTALGKTMSSSKIDAQGSAHQRDVYAVTLHHNFGIGLPSM